MDKTCETRRETMLYVGGSKTSFYCDCGCNVFGRLGPNSYECNSCGATYSDATKDRDGQPQSPALLEKETGDE